MAIFGILNLFKDFGLSTAAVQRAEISNEQHSTLFWVNMMFGGLLSLVALGAAPAVAAFYHEPRLSAVTAVLAAGFIFNAAGVQHGALLQRQLRFTMTGAIDVGSQLAGLGLAVVLAVKGHGYWALVGMTIATPFVSTACLWVAVGWNPGKPHLRDGIDSMLRFGGTITLNGLVVYLAYNLEKLLLGRFCGAEAVGLYGRAYQLASIPTDNLNASAGSVAFAALSRIQDQPELLKSYFLKGYAVVLAMTVPVTIAGALFADELILVVLGTKWQSTAPIFRLLAPTIIVFAVINPLAWLLFSLGLVGRSLRIALILAPLVISGYAIGLPYGPKGVAFGYSAVMTLWVVPHLALCVHGTVVRLRDLLDVILRPLVSALTAGAVSAAILYSYGHTFSPVLRLALGGSLFAGVYLAMLLGVMKQKDFYLDLCRGFKRSTVEGKVLVSV